MQNYMLRPDRHINILFIKQQNRVLMYKLDSVIWTTASIRHTQAL